MSDIRLHREPEHQPEAFTEIQSLILTGPIEAAIEKWDKVMEDEFMCGVAWEQDGDGENTNPMNPSELD